MKDEYTTDELRQIMFKCIESDQSENILIDWLYDNSYTTKDDIDKDWDTLIANMEDALLINIMSKQKLYCDIRGVPFFAPSDGKCPHCRQPIIDTYKEHITGCSHCNRSFCE